MKTAHFQVEGPASHGGQMMIPAAQISAVVKYKVGKKVWIVDVWSSAPFPIRYEFNTEEAATACADSILDLTP